MSRREVIAFWSDGQKQIVSKLTVPSTMQPHQARDIWEQVESDLQTNNSQATLAGLLIQDNLQQPLTGFALADQDATIADLGSMQTRQLETA